MIRYKFSKEVNQEFSKTLRVRVSGYFKRNNISRKANTLMVNKVIFASLVYFAIYGLMMFANISSLPLMFLLYMLLGLGQTFIGTSVMHDVLHGSFSKNKWVNALMHIPIVAIGVEPTVWRIQHNVLHHTYTNIDDADEDIASRYVLRMTENQPRKWFHSFQHYYVTFFYSLLTIIWVTVKDFIKLKGYAQAGLVTTKEAFFAVLKVLGTRIVYYGMFLVAPAYFLDYTFVQVFLMFISMLLVSGLLLSIIFQMAHVVQDCVAIQQDEELIKENWYVHQLMTTSNFAIHNKYITYFIGGLNYQVEHHLFPDVCHVHYPELSKIVKETAEEYGIPYHCQSTFGLALASHYKHLKDLGQNDMAQVTSGFVYV